MPARDSSLRNIESRTNRAETLPILVAIVICRSNLDRQGRIPIGEVPVRYLLPRRQQRGKEHILPGTEALLYSCFTVLSPQSSRNGGHSNILRTKVGGIVPNSVHGRKVLDLRGRYLVRSSPLVRVIIRRDRGGKISTTMVPVSQPLFLLLGPLHSSPDLHFASFSSASSFLSWLFLHLH